jgi:hypothetical protein
VILLKMIASIRFIQWRPCHAGDCCRAAIRRFIGFLILAMLVPMHYCNLATAQGIKNKAHVGTSQVQKTVESPISYSEITYKSGNRRDPFLNPLLTKKGSQQEDSEESRGTPPPGIAGTFIAQAMLQGVVVRDRGRVAVVRGADSRAYFLREGDRLFDGYLKVIENDSITLVRETKMRSGKVLTQDVTKRLRTP